MKAPVSEEFTALLILVLQPGLREIVACGSRCATVRGYETTPQISVMVNSHNLFCWCGGYFNQSNETSRAHLQLDLALDVLSLYMRDLMRLRGDIWDCLDDCQAVWWQTYPARQLIPELPRFCRCVEKTKQLGDRDCQTKEARKLEYQSRKRSPPIKGEGGSVQNRHMLAKNLACSTCILFIYWLFIWQQWLAYTQVWWPRGVSFAAGGSI